MRDQDITDREEYWGVSVEMDDVTKTFSAPQCREFYVYAHRDNKGAIFYIGKGTGRRAWSEDRHLVWHRYVKERLNGSYSVEILENGLTEDEAETREGELIAKFGPRLVNWQNSGRGFDYAALEQYHALRGANLLFIASTRPLEDSDLNTAIDRYRQALKNLRAYEGLMVETGIVAELSCDLKIGDLNILDRLTLCLVRSGRSVEARAEVEQYFNDFPAARNMSKARRILKRVQMPTADSDSNTKCRKGDHLAVKQKRQSWQGGSEVREIVAIPKDPVERNLQGSALEREGDVENAIEFYQANVRDGFEGNFPYDRLAVIFRKRGDFASEIIVLKRAIEIFSGLRDSPRLDIAPKLARFTARLLAAERLAKSESDRKSAKY